MSKRNYFIHYSFTTVRGGGEGRTVLTSTDRITGIQRIEEIEKAILEKHNTTYPDEAPFEAVIVKGWRPFETGR